MKYKLYISNVHNSLVKELVHCKVKLTEHLPELLGSISLLLLVGGAGLPIHPLWHVQQPGVCQHLPAKLQGKVLDNPAKQFLLVWSLSIEISLALYS